MKIVRVCEFMIPQLGGISANEYYLCREMVKRGHEVTLFTSDLAPSRYRLNIKAKGFEEYVEGFKVIRCGTVANLGGDMPIMPSLSLKMNKIREADVIHAHEYYNYTSIIAHKTAKRKKIPFTYTQERYYWIKRKAWRMPFWIANKTVYKQVRQAPKLVTAFTTAARDFLAKQGYPQDSIRVIPMGIDTRKFKPFNDDSFREYLGLSDEPLILSVTRLHPSKGVDVLLKAFKVVKQRVPGAKLVIMGRGPWEAKIRVLIKSLNLEGSSSLITEHMSYNEMPKVYNACDIFVLPSLYEPFGMVVLEAMACGKPVVGSDTGGMTDMIAHGESGFKVKAGHIGTLAEALLALLSDSKLVTLMGSEARRRVEEFYNWSVVADNYEEFYRYLMRSIDVYA